MDAILSQVQWPENLMHYLLFDLAMLGIVVLGYFSIKIIALLLSKHSKNHDHYH